MNFIIPKNSSSKFLAEDFIDNYISEGNPFYALIYLHALRLAEKGEETEISKIALKFSLLEKDVVNAFCFWEEKELLSFDKEKELIIFIKKAPYKKSEISYEEFTERCSEKKVSKFIEGCQKRMGRLLSPWEIQVFLDIHDWIGLEKEVIYTIIDYCRAKGKLQIRYIEKMALDWKEKGITSEEAGLDYINIYETEFRDIMKALGKSGFSPARADEEYFIKWLKKMKMPLEIVLEACDRTVKATGKPSLQYADKILENWKDAGVKIKEDILCLDAKFNKEKSGKDFYEKEGRENKKEPHISKAEKKNRFVNFPQREWDFEKMKKNERERRKKILGNEKTDELEF